MQQEQVTQVHQPMGLGRLVVIDTCFALIRPLNVQRSDSCTMKMSPNKGEAAVHGYLVPGDMPVRMREVLAWP